MVLPAKDNEDLEQILRDHFTSPFRSGYIQHDGVTMPARYLELKEKIDIFEVYDDDIWVCSFPKTGTTWTQEIVWLLANKFDYEGAKEYIQSRFPFLEVSILFDFRKMISENPDFKPPPHYIDSLKFIEKMQRPRLIKTHLPWNLLPKQIQNGEKTPKIIYVARNPKDTCISYYHHCQTFEAYSGDFESFCKLFLRDKLCFSPFWKNLGSFWERKHFKNIFFIKFEDMKSDVGSVIKRLAEFLKVDMNDDQLENLVKHVSFQSMKNNPAVNYDNIINDLNEKFNLKPRSSFMRSGAVGGYKGMMSNEILEEFDKWSSVNNKDIDVGY